MLLLNILYVCLMMAYIKGSLTRKETKQVYSFTDELISAYWEMLEYTKQIVFVYLLITIQKTRASHDINETVHFLNDLVRNEFVPSVLNMKVCWTRQETTHLMKFMNSPIQFVTDSEKIALPLGDFTNKIWFIVDMRCNGSRKLLREVKHHQYFNKVFRQ